MHFKKKRPSLCNSMKNVISIIMGGGRGTRLYPLTKARCKPAVSLAGKYRLVDIPISNCINSGCKRIYLLTQFNTASLHRHIQQTYKFDPFGGGFVDILAAEQTDAGGNWYQGTADAVRKNMHHFSSIDSEYYLILSGDQLYQMDFKKLVEAHKASGADVTIAAKPMPTSVASELGIMRVDKELNITEFVEKPKDKAVINSLIIPDDLKAGLKDQTKDYCLASMGIYVFSAKILEEKMRGTEIDFGKEIIPSMLGQKKLCAYIFDDYWEDIGTIDAFFEANLALTDDNPEFDFYNQEKQIYTHTRYLPSSKIYDSSMDHTNVAEGCVVKTSKLKRCMIGVRSVIRDNCELDNVVMMGADVFQSEEEKLADDKQGIPRIGIGKNCKIKNAIIDKNARIGDNVELSPEGKPDQWEEGSLYVRDGVIIVMKNGIVPSNTKI